MELFLGEMERANVKSCVALFSIRNPRDVDLPEVKRRLLGRLKGDLWSKQASILEGIRGYVGSLPTVTNIDAALLASRHPGRFIPFGSVYVNGSEEQLQKELNEVEKLGLKGLKLLPTLQLFNPSESRNFQRICEWCEKKNKIIVYHTGCDPGPFEIPEVAEDANPKYLAPVMEHYSPRIVLAHFGAYSAHHPGIWFDEAISLAKKFGNVYADTSAAVDFILREENLKRIRDEVGLDKLLFGTDFPVVAGSSIRTEVDAVKSCQGLSDEEKEMVLGGNASTLLGIR